MTELRKTWIHALIACALGVAIGLLSDGARAADTPAQAAYGICTATGGDWLICYMKHVGEEAAAMKTAQGIMENCVQEKKTHSWGWIQMYSACPQQLAYIKQRWAY